MKCSWIALALLIASTSTSTAGEGWRTSDGRRVSDTEARKSVNGFAGWLLATSDANWREKWETPSTTTPRFTEATVVRRGQRIAILTFFANPLLRKGAADVTCDIEILRPNGTSLNQAGARCYQGPVTEDPSHVFLSSQIIQFVGEPGDPTGRWVVHIVLHDNVRHTSIPLTTSFVLK